MTDIEKEKTTLENRHSKMVAFFNDIKIDRFKDRAKFVDECILYLEPEDLRDKYIDLVKLFNKSMDIVLPDSFAMKFEYDLKVYNDIKIMAIRENQNDLSKVTKEEIKKIQTIIDEHLKASGLNYLLEEAVDITDPEKFLKELEGKSGNRKELIIKNRIKHTIQANKKENPDFYKDIAKRLEELIKAKEEDRITQAQLLIEFDKLQEEIRNSKEEWKRLGLASKEQFPIFKTLEKVVPNPKEFTIGVFDKVGMYLQKSDWKDHDDIKKEIRKEIKSLLRKNAVDKEIVNSLPITILEILENQ